MSQIDIGDANGNSVGIRLNRANRHGFVAGATGTGKTVTLQRMAEQLSRAGVPVLMADIKGDLTGIGQPNTGPAAPVKHWDLYGINGQGIKIRLASMGPQLVARLLDLSETQEGAITIAFHVAVQYRMPIDTLDNLASVIRFMAKCAPEISQRFGRCSPQTLATIQRKILVLEGQSGMIFGKSNLQIEDMMQVQGSEGVVNLLDATNLINNSSLYSTFLLWLLGELFKKLPEVGDVDKPKLVFFFDEAHLLFRDAPKALMERIEQTVRLIRSKGVGIYFVTQNSSDIPDVVLAQLSNRIQHALRAYTPNEQKGLRAAASSFRENPSLDTLSALQNMGVGEALISTLDDRGVPQVVQLTKVHLPESKVGPADPQYRPIPKRVGHSKRKNHSASSTPLKIDFKRIQKAAQITRKIWRGGLLSLVLNK